MRVIVNDQATELPDAATVADLLVQLALPGTRVAVEVNRQLVRRVQHGDTRLNDGDTIEVVTLVGGGALLLGTTLAWRRVANGKNFKPPVKEGETALLSASDDRVNFSENLLRLVEDDALRQRLSNQGVDYALRQFSHLRLAKDMSNLYRKLLS